MAVTMMVTTVENCGQSARRRKGGSGSVGHRQMTTRSGGQDWFRKTLGTSGDVDNENAGAIDCRRRTGDGEKRPERDADVVAGS